MDNPGDINKAMDSHNNKEVQGGVNNLNRVWFCIVKK
jgi:hypothetical protein